MILMVIILQIFIETIYSSEVPTCGSNSECTIGTLEGIPVINCFCKQDNTLSGIVNSCYSAAVDTPKLIINVRTTVHGLKFVIDEPYGGITWENKTKICLSIHGFENIHYEANSCIVDSVQADNYTKFMLNREFYDKSENITCIKELLLHSKFLNKTQQNYILNMNVPFVPPTVQPAKCVCPKCTTNSTVCSSCMYRTLEGCTDYCRHNFESIPGISLSKYMCQSKCPFLPISPNLHECEGVCNRRLNVNDTILGLELSLPHETFDRSNRKGLEIASISIIIIETVIIIYLVVVLWCKVKKINVQGEDVEDIDDYEMPNMYGGEYFREAEDEYERC